MCKMETVCLYKSMADSIDMETERKTKKRYYAQMMWDQCSVWSIDNHRKKKTIGDDHLVQDKTKEDQARTLHTASPNLSCSYGNTGYEVFKGGIQNQKSFWLKINCIQMKLPNFKNWSNGELSKFGHHLRKLSDLKPNFIKKCQNKKMRSLIHILQ